MAHYAAFLVLRDASVTPGTIELRVAGESATRKAGAIVEGPSGCVAVPPGVERARRNPFGLA